MIKDEQRVAMAQPIREYEELFDLSSHTTSYTGSDEFYGRPLAAGVSTPQQVMEAIHPEDIAYLGQVLEQLAELQDGETLQYDLRFRHTNGCYVRARYVSTPAERGPNGLVKVLRSTVCWLEFE